VQELNSAQLGAKRRNQRLRQDGHPVLGTLAAPYGDLPALEVEVLDP
jgi:hypothetical protein